MAHIRNANKSDKINLATKDQSSQVPTCLVITSSESASSVDRQFQSVCEEVRNIKEALPIILDERKCTNLKNTI